MGYNIQQFLFKFLDLNKALLTGYRSSNVQQCLTPISSKACMHANDRCVFKRSMAVPAESVSSGMFPNARGTKAEISKPVTPGVSYEGIGCNWEILALQ